MKFYWHHAAYEAIGDASSLGILLTGFIHPDATVAQPLTDLLWTTCRNVSKPCSGPFTEIYKFIKVEAYVLSANNHREGTNIEEAQLRDV